jgi:Rrf2 family protein
MLALARLAKDYGKGPILIGDIASGEQIPQRFLEGILLDLKKMGVLGSRLGKTGGYYLIRKPSEVTLEEIVTHFEGTIGMLYCISENTYQPCEFCRKEEHCKIRDVFQQIRNETLAILKKTTIDQLVENEAF